MIPESAKNGSETGSADEFQRDTAPLEVDLDDADADVLVDFEDIGGTGDPAAAPVGTGGTHTGDVNQAVLLDTGIREERLRNRVSR